MATLILSAAGAALGGSIGGSVVGLSTAVLGRAVGATLGSALDQRLLGAGAAPVESGRIDRLRVMGSSEGVALPRVFGRMRVPGQLVWSSRFRENVSTERVGGKGTGAGSREVRRYSYSISLALALCEGEVFRIGRIWADGQPVAQDTLTWRLHTGSESQLPDPLIQAIEGASRAPAYRGTAYVVIEDLDLTPFGNRIPQLGFEVFRRPRAEFINVPRAPSLDVRGIALVPGTGEYSLATVPVSVGAARGSAMVANVHNDRNLPDLVVSLDQMEAELPRCKAVSLVVSWFGNDLRADRCKLYPAVEQREEDGEELPWSVAGVERSAAATVSRVDGRPLFGGTPADEAVVQAIRNMTGRGMAVMFYPFILMDLLRGNGRQNPWHPEGEQPPVPWRGRITLSHAPGVSGSPDKSAAAAVEVERFFGTAAPAHFAVKNGRVVYSGPAEWSYRRFILHYAALCAVAGGIDAFCIGSEMRSLTQIRDGSASYPGVRELCRLAADVRSILGPRVKISYAADWSEYFGHQPPDGSGDLIFHLDPLWAHTAIDFIGIDNYMPLSDWRDGPDHIDAAAGSIYDLGYLRSNIAGGEGFDWYYPDQAARDAQERHPIEDGAYGEPWTFRYKDLISWWSKSHFDRIGGVRRAEQTAWQPRSKPIWFTELGCPAVEKGTNQPNVFYDPKSSESFFPHYSDGSRDDFIQQRYLQAHYAHWAQPAHNPWSSHYDGRMVDVARTFVWAWDARPWPDFPLRLETWVDGHNFSRGHWLNARLAKPSLGDIVAEICETAGLQAVAVAEVYGAATGYAISSVETGRQSLQPLMLGYAFDAFASGAKLQFRAREAAPSARLDLDRLAQDGREPRISVLRSSIAELGDRVSIAYVGESDDYPPSVAEVVNADSTRPGAAEIGLPLVLEAGEARAIAARWLCEAHVARESASFILPPSSVALEAGDVVVFSQHEREHRFRIDRIEDRGARSITAVRVEPSAYQRAPFEDAPEMVRPIQAPTAAFAAFLDLPILQGEEAPLAPHVAVLRQPWRGPVAIYGATLASGFERVDVAERPAAVGTLAESLVAGVPGLWMPGPLYLRLDGGALESRARLEVLAGANVAVLKDAASPDVEVIQFESAELVGSQVYRLTNLLRGQAGTDGVMPAIWPAGTDFILLNVAVGELAVPVVLNSDQVYRYGPAEKPYGDASYRQQRVAFRGVGLRPYRPGHVAADRLANGDIIVRWIRRTRIGGDGWDGFEVPLGEERELYLVRVWHGDELLRQATVDQSVIAYNRSDQLVDGGGWPRVVEISQVSQRFGTGPAIRIKIDV